MRLEMLENETIFLNSMHHIELCIISHNKNDEYFKNSVSCYSTHLRIRSGCFFMVIWFVLL